MKTLKTVLNTIIFVLFFTMISCQKEEFQPPKYSFSVVEGTTNVGTIDNINFVSPEFKITGGEDSALFTINNLGELSFKNAPSYISNLATKYSIDTTVVKNSVFNLDNKYIVEITISDNKNIFLENITVIIIPSNIIQNGFETLKSANTEIGSVTDIDGNVYQTVIIGSQEWMIENLRVTHYNNGDSIPVINIDDNWMNLTTGACCYFNGDNSNKYCGILYNNFASMSSLAPQGWHVPSRKDFEILNNYCHENNIEFPANYSGYERWDQFYITGYGCNYHWWTSENTTSCAVCSCNDNIFDCFGNESYVGFCIVCVKN